MGEMPTWRVAKDRHKFSLRDMLGTSDFRPSSRVQQLAFGCEQIPQDPALVLIGRLLELLLKTLDVESGNEVVFDHAPSLSAAPQLGVAKIEFIVSGNSMYQTSPVARGQAICTSGQP